MLEFTGERVVPGQADVDLLNEHLARYTFSARLAGGKRVLDAGCGAGYGSAELARIARSVVGADIAAEAVDFARAHYPLPNLCFEQASCTALPHPDGRFDLVVAFEVIEHLQDWRALLSEARRLLAPGGQFVVSTPNRLYYTESRGASGANPFHVHEFDFAEFSAALAAVFPDVSLFLENHVEGFSFQPRQAGRTAEVRVDAAQAQPDDSHFFVAVCADRPQIGNPTFVYIPRSANLLRERERHIALLETELAAKNRWLDESHREHERLLETHRQLQEELKRGNQWAESLDRELAGRSARIVEIQKELVDQAAGYEAQIAAMQQEVAGEQERALAVAQGYRTKVSELEQDLEAKAQWALGLDAQLKTAVEALHRTEQELTDRTAWANQLDEANRGLRQQVGAFENQLLQLAEKISLLQNQLEMYRQSRWVKLGRTVGLGPAQQPR